MSDVVNNDLAGKRLLVVGASVSIGEAIASTALARGATVTVAARRKDNLDQIVASAPDRATAIQTDCMIADDCVRLIDGAVAAMGGLDWLVYTPALFLLRDLEELTADEWHQVLGLNLVGAALVTSAALPHLGEARGKAVYFSSESAHPEPHWPGLASYAVSKVALEKMIKCWRVERTDINFSIIEAGPTDGSDGPVGGGWTEEQFNKFLPRWQGMRPHIQPRSAIVDSVLHVLTSPSYIEHVTVGPPRL
ncbi:MAG TPA: SDR family oxidoreductase [Ilumatobacteraceae bacterium]|nr:SDR family oxidoreductase [Ilumatobacteraceae bacterium]